MQAKVSLSRSGALLLLRNNCINYTQKGARVYMVKANNQHSTPAREKARWAFQYAWHPLRFIFTVF